MGRNKEVAKKIITTYLSGTLNAEAVYVIYEIGQGNDELLLEHIKALKNIFEGAIKEIEGEKDVRN